MRSMSASESPRPFIAKKIVLQGPGLPRSSRWAAALLPSLWT